MNKFSIRALDEIVDSISDSAKLFAPREICVAALATVVAHPHVKLWISQQPQQAQQKFVSGLFQLGLAAVSVGGADNAVMSPTDLVFDVLSVIGELCRREASEDAKDKQMLAHSRELQKHFVTLFCTATVPCDLGAMLAVVKFQSGKIQDETLSAICQDIMAALPVNAMTTQQQQQQQQEEVEQKAQAPNDDAKKSKDTKKKKKKKESDAEAKDGDGAIASTDSNDEDQKKAPASKAAAAASAATTATAATTQSAAATVLASWSSKQKDLSKDLLFLDARRYTSFALPLVSRAPRFLCALPNCHKVLTDPKCCSFCRSVNYCSSECSKAHWSQSHKIACLAVKKAAAEADASNNSNKLHSGQFLKDNADARAAFTSLFFESRAFKYLTRNNALKDVSFDDYFMSYS